MSAEDTPGAAGFTPGPWEAVRHPGMPGEEMNWSGWHVKQPGSGLHDVAYVDDVDYGPKVAAANARLIAQAPAAHAMLMGLAEWFANGNSPSPSSLFDDDRTWGQALSDYLAQAGGR